MIPIYMKCWNRQNYSTIEEHQNSGCLWGRFGAGTDKEMMPENFLGDCNALYLDRFEWHMCMHLLKPTEWFPEDLSISVYVYFASKEKETTTNKYWILTNDMYDEVFRVRVYWCLQFTLKHIWIDKWMEGRTDA